MKRGTKNKLDPKCFKGFPMAISNEGYLLPCCYCEDRLTYEDPNFQKLLKVSKINDYNSIEEILNTKEWKKFEKNLTKHKGPDCCHTVCGIVKDESSLHRKDTHYSSEGKIKNTRRV